MMNSIGNKLDVQNIVTVCYKAKDVNTQGNCIGDCMKMLLNEADDTMVALIEQIRSDEDGGICPPKLIGQILSQFHVSNEDTRKAAFIGYICGSMRMKADERMA